MNSGLEKKLSMDELLEKNRPAQMVQTTPQLPTRTQMEELLKAVKHLEQMSEQAGKRNEKRFSLPNIRRPRLRLLHLDGPTWAVLLMGTAALLLLWWGLGTVWSSLSLLSL